MYAGLFKICISPSRIKCEPLHPSHMESSSTQAEFVDEHDGVRLKKTLNDDEYELPSIEYIIKSEREETVSVTIRDPIPDGISAENIGFHRDYGKDCWEIDGGDLVFRCSLEPDEEFKTVYAFRAGSVEVSGELLVSPESIDIEPSLSSAPEPNEITRSSSNSPYPASDQPQSSESDEESNAGGVDLGEMSDVEAIDVGTSNDSLVDKLAEEIQNDEPSPESLEILQDHVVPESTSTGSAGARLSQLQEDVSNLRAYTTALEEFLDEEGSAQEIMESIEERMDEVEAEIHSLQSTIPELEADIESVTSNLKQLDGSVERMSSELDELGDDIGTIEEDVDSIDKRIPDYSIEERFTDLESELDTVSEFVENLKTAFE